MYYADGAKNGRENGYIVDIGGMVSKNYKDRTNWGIAGIDSKHDAMGLSHMLERTLKTGHGVDEILKAFHD